MDGMDCVRVENVVSPQFGVLGSGLAPAAQDCMCRDSTGEHDLDVRYRSLPLLAEMADGFGAPRYGLASYCGPSPFSRCEKRAHFRALLACAI